MNEKLRFAPAPSGDLHLGNLWTCFWNFYTANFDVASLILRIDDTNSECSMGKLQVMLRELNYFNFEFSQVVFQSYRTKLYHQWLSNKGILTHPSRWLISGKLQFYDQVRGRLLSKKFNEPIYLTRSDERATYYLSNLVDDETLGITKIVRASDHIDNTFKQVSLSNHTWLFYHVPILETDDSKISKRTGESEWTVSTLIEEGFLSEAVKSFFLSKQKSLKLNSFKVSKKELLHFNRNHLIGLDDSSYLRVLEAYLSYSGEEELKVWCVAVSILRKTGRFKTLAEVKRFAIDFKSKYNKFVRLIKVREASFWVSTNNVNLKRSVRIFLFQDSPSPSLLDVFKVFTFYQFLSLTDELTQSQK